MARLKYDPRVIKILIEDCANRAELGTNSKDLIALATTIDSYLRIQEGTDEHISEKYIDTLYRNCKDAIDETKNIVREDYKIATLLKYIEVNSIDDYHQDNAKRVIETNTSKQSNTKGKVTDYRKPLDAYDIRARLLPLSIGLLPIVFFLASLPFNKQIVGSLGDWEIVSVVILGLMGVLYGVIALSDLVSGLSKVYQNKYFMKVNGLPSTYLMLYQDHTYTEDHKDKYRLKVLQLSGIKLLGKEDELKDKAKAIQTLNTATEYVKQYIYEGLVSTQNIRYGFTRNLIGATFLGIPFSIMTSIVGIISNSITLVLLSTSMVVLYSVILIFKKHLLFEAAEAYGKELLANFLKKE